MNTRAMNWTVSVILALGAGYAGAANRYWTNAGEGSWSDPANWGGTEPTTNDTVYIQNGGTALCEAGEESLSLFLGEAVDGSGTIRLEDGDDSLLVRFNPFYWGRRATGTVVQSAGTLMASNGVQMGYYDTGHALYFISGGTGVFNGLEVGHNLSTADVFQSGGRVQVKAGWNIKRGLYRLTDGVLESAAVTTINGGRMEIDGATAVYAHPGGQHTYIGNGADGVLDLKAGSVTNAGNFYVGHQRTGTVTQTGGIVKQQAAKSIGLGTYASGVGIWNLHGGVLEVAKHSSAYQSLVLGSAGGSTGLFNMGNASGCGILTQQVAGVGMYVGNGGIGVFTGWSDAGDGNRFCLSGPMYVNRGRLVADGYGTDRALDMSPLSGFFSTVSNALDGEFGCYARSRGELRLPAIPVSGSNTYYWGEQGSLDLVNGARLLLTGASGSLTGRLYAVDHGSVPPLGFIRAVSMHAFDVGGMTGCNLAIRYDHVAAAAEGLPEEELKLFRSTGSTWGDVTTLVETNTRTIRADGLPGLGWFAVGKRMPIQGSLLIIQ